jgi:predicted short-subunit dehydrogenase-like oxidoreductase (DUF2520 family)
LNLPCELLVDIAKLLPPVQRSRTLPSLCRTMYQAELLSWSCQTSRTSVLVGREAKEECIARFSSLQRVVRQAILRNSDFVLVQSIYVSSVFSIMAHTILAKAVELPDTDHRKLQRLLQALTSLSDQAIGVVPSERGSGKIVAWKRFLPRTALEHCWGVNELDRLRTMKMFVEGIITSELDHPVHKFFRLRDYQEEKVYLC